MSGSCFFPLPRLKRDLLWCHRLCERSRYCCRAQVYGEGGAVLLGCVLNDTHSLYIVLHLSWALMALVKSSTLIGCHLGCNIVFQAPAPSTLWANSPNRQHLAELSSGLRGRGVTEGSQGKQNSLLVSTEPGPFSSFPLISLSVEKNPAFKSLTWGGLPQGKFTVL